MNDEGAISKTSEGQRILGLASSCTNVTGTAILYFDWGSLSVVEHCYNMLLRAGALTWRLMDGCSVVFGHSCLWLCLSVAWRDPKRPIRNQRQEEARINWKWRKQRRIFFILLEQKILNRQHTHTLKNIYCKARDNSEEVTSSNPQNCIVHILPAIMKITVIASLLSSAGAFLSPPAANGNGFPLSSSTATTTDLERREESTFIAQPLQDNTLKSVQAIQDISRAEYENGKFECNDGVEFWMNYNRNGKYELEDYARVTTDVSSRFFSEGGGALSYWLRHTARSGYFISNAALGTLSSQLHERLRSKEPSESKVSKIMNASPKENINFPMTCTREIDRIHPSISGRKLLDS